MPGISSTDWCPFLCKCTVGEMLHHREMLPGLKGTCYTGFSDDCINLHHHLQCILTSICVCLLKKESFKLGWDDTSSGFYLHFPQWFVILSIFHILFGHLHTLWSLYHWLILCVCLFEDFAMHSCPAWNSLWSTDWSCSRGSYTFWVPGSQVCTT